MLGQPFQANKFKMGPVEYRTFTVLDLHTDLTIKIELAITLPEKMSTEHVLPDTHLSSLARLRSVSCSLTLSVR